MEQPNITLAAKDDETKGEAILRALERDKNLFWAEQMTLIGNAIIWPRIESISASEYAND